MKSSRIRSPRWAPGSTAVHSNFSDVHQHLDDSPHLLEEMLQQIQAAPEQTAVFPQTFKAKVLFQFFDGWPMSES